MKPIIFNTEMIKAILDGRKTQFRLPIKLKNNLLIYTGYIVDSTDRERIGKCAFGINKERNLEYVKPKYKVGDILYVKETWSNIYKTDGSIMYKADWNGGDGRVEVYDTPIKWKPSVHLKQEDARIFLKVTNVRVERLLDMDIREETGSFNIMQHKKFYDNWNSTAKDGYKWQDNPYVFVYDFEKVDEVK